MIEYLLGPYGGTIEFSRSMVMFFCLIIFIVYYMFTIKERKSWIDSRGIVVLFFIFYSLSVASLTFMPLSITPRHHLHYFGEMPLWQIAVISTDLLPFRSIYITLTGSIWWVFTVRAIVGNIILLFPLPFFLGLLSKKEFTFKKAVTIGFLTSFAIETTQLLLNLLTHFPQRSVLIDDLILNTLGVAIGYFVFKKCQNFFEAVLTAMCKILTMNRA